MSSMMKQLVGGMKWTGSATALNTVMQLTQYAVLARLLDKSDFGLMGMITVIIAFGQVFTDLGVGNAIVHRKNVTHEQLSSLYWLNIFTGLLVSAVVFLISPIVADFYNEPQLVNLLHLMSIIFIIIPFGQQFQYVMQKNLEFDRIAKTEITSVLLGTGTSILLALFGFGVYSLILGQIVFHSTKSILFGIQGWKNWKPGFIFKLNELRGFLSFGFYQMGSRTISYFASNIDYILIGRFLGADILGIYTIAYQLVVVPVTKINPIITKVAFPLFAKEQDNHDSLSKGFTDMSKLLAIITFPILLGMMSTADVLVPVIFGNQWESSIPLVQVLALLGLLRVLMNPNGSVLLAKGRADIGFKWDIGVASINAICFYFAVQYGVMALAYTYVFVAVLNFLLGRILLNKVIGLKGKEYFLGLSKPAVISTGMGLIVYGLYQLIHYIGAEPSILFLGILVIAGVLIYFGLLWIIDRIYILDLKIMLSRKKTGIKDQ